MAHEIFKAISNLRMALNTETDADSPDNETTYGAIRSRVEYLMEILLGTGFEGTVTGIATTTITHAEAAQDVDEHNGRTTIITSGLAKGEFYTIDDTAAQTLIHTGDDLEADGVAINDTFKVLYDIKTNVGHTHDDVDSPNVVLADLSIATAKLQNDSVTIEKIQHGTLHSLPSESDQMTALTETGENGFQTKATHRIYIPADATTLYGTLRARRAVDGVSCNVRFTVDGNASSTYNVDHTAYQWSDEISLDCSALSGWLELDIDLDAQVGRTTEVQGYSFRWG